MNVWKLVSGVALLLLAGILFGSVGTWLLVKPAHHMHGPKDFRNRTMEATERLSKSLDLNAEQKIAVGRILEQMSQKLHEHFLKGKPEVDRIIDGSFSEIKNELNDAQKKKLDTVREQFRKHRRGHAR
ncbi:MAG: hypothetical protein LBQ00_09415 [Syntrophobacterales bacterium]|jgi:hypothetical protein|nr:hypothetical protein [Syntrophobacterales bacterium]